MEVKVPLKELMLLTRLEPVLANWMSLANVASKAPVNPVKSPLRELILETKVEPVDARLVMVA